MERFRQPVEKKQGEEQARKGVVDKSANVKESILASSALSDFIGEMESAIPSKTSAGATTQVYLKSKALQKEEVNFHVLELALKEVSKKIKEEATKKEENPFV